MQACVVQYALFTHGIYMRLTHQCFLKWHQNLWYLQEATSLDPLTEKEGKRSTNTICMEKAKQVLGRNQHPPNFYDPIIKDSLNTILRKCQQIEHPSEENSTTKKFPLMIQYRGKCSEEYARALHRCSASCTIIMTIRKLRTTMPSLKPPVEKMIRSGIVYKITCPRCTAWYVG